MLNSSVDPLSPTVTISILSGYYLVLLDTTDFNRVRTQSDAQRRSWCLFQLKKGSRKEKQAHIQAHIYTPLERTFFAPYPIPLYMWIVSFNIWGPSKDIIPPVKICETFSSIFRINMHKQDVAYNINPLLMVSTKYKELIRQLLYVGKQVTSHFTTMRIKYQYV